VLRCSVHQLVPIAETAAAYNVVQCLASRCGFDVGLNAQPGYGGRNLMKHGHGPATNARRTVERAPRTCTRAFPILGTDVAARYRASPLT
jgi:hypothetical protein